MSLKTREILDKIKAELESITPSIGRVHASLRASASPEDLITDYLFKDPIAGKVIKAFVVRSGAQRIERMTVGRPGFSQRFRTVTIDGFVTIQHKNPVGAEGVLEDAFDLIISKLQTLTRLETEPKGDTFQAGTIELTAIGVAKVSNHNVVAAQLMTVIQDRFLGA